MSTQIQSHQTTNDYHGHPNYFIVWLALVIMLGLSLLCAEIGDRRLAVSLIFALAIVKAILVLGSFMHLRWEPKLLWGIIGIAVLCLFALYYGVFIDIVTVPLAVAQ